MSSPAISGLMTDAEGLTFAHVDAEEAAFLYEEIFVRQAYFQHGITLPRTGAPVVLDCGANIGLFSLLCLRVNPRARVIACEPSPATFDLLESNLADAAHAQCFRIALGDKQRTSVLHVYADAPGESSRHDRERTMQRKRLMAAVAAVAASGETSEKKFGGAAVSKDVARVASEAGRAVRCSVRRGDELVHALGLPRIDLLKVDVEGDELAVLRGMGAALRMVRQVVLEVHDIHGRLWRSLCLLRRHGFRTTAVRQRSSTVQGYHMFIPDELHLYYVYAHQRAGHRTRSTSRRRPSSVLSAARRT